MQPQLLIPISPDELKKLIDEAVSNAVQQALQREKTSGKDTMNVKEVADFLGISKSAIYRYTHERTIPHYKKGKKLHFKRPEIEKWRDSGKQLTQEEFNEQARLKIHR